MFLRWPGEWSHARTFGPGREKPTATFSATARALHPRSTTPRSWWNIRCWRAIRLACRRAYRSRHLPFFSALRPWALRTLLVCLWSFLSKLVTEIASAGDDGATTKIGRASCRERVMVWGVAGSWEAV